MSESKLDPRARLRHDLRTPIHQIIGYAELLADEARDGGHEAYLPDLEKIRVAARRALEAVEEAVPPVPSSGAPVVFREPSLARSSPEPPPPARGPLPPPRAAEVRLLVVDDNELNRDMLSFSSTS
jgi:hypothetical protein